MSTKLPADPPMERGPNPVRPAVAPTPRKPAGPPPKSGFQRFVLQFLLLAIALGGAFGTGYLVNANEMQLNQNGLLQQQLDAQERILALELQIAELQERRESGNRVELDLTEVFEPIREAVGRIALVRMSEISREITTELTRLVGDDLPALDDPANAAGAVAPGDSSAGTAGDRTSEPEAVSAGEAAPPPSADGPNSLQPSSAVSDASRVPDQPDTIELAAGEPEGAPSPVPAVSNASPAGELPVAENLGLPEPAGEAASREASLSEALNTPADGSGLESTESSTQRERNNVAQRVEAPSPTTGSPGGAPTTEP